MLHTIISSMMLLLLSAMDAKVIDRSTVDNFNVKEFTGVWHEIARFDTRYERNLIDVTAHYELCDNGMLKVINRGFNTKKREWQETEGKAKLTPYPGQLKVSFFMNIYSDYNIMALDPNYQWALVGSKSPSFLWILAREKQIPQQTLDNIISLARDRGYQVEELNILM